MGVELVAIAAEELLEHTLALGDEAFVPAEFPDVDVGFAGRPLISREFPDFFREVVLVVRWPFLNFLVAVFILKKLIERISG